MFMPKAVIFDCYNTLLYYRSEEEKDGIWEMMVTAVEYMTEKPLAITPEELETLYKEEFQKEAEECERQRGPHAEICMCRIWQNVMIHLQIPRELAKEKAEDILLVYRLYTRKRKYLFPNVKKELMALKEQGMKLILLSNAQTCFLYNELPEEIRDLFDVLLISEVIGIKKPDENAFRLAFERFGTDPEHIVFVGDSAEDDMIPAGRLGCHCIMIGKLNRKDSRLAHVHAFDPHRESGYEGLTEMIVSLDKDV